MLPHRQIRCRPDCTLNLFLITFPSSLITEAPCVTFCSPAVRTACVDSGQRRSCRVTASCLVTITTTLLANTVPHPGVLATPATGSCTGVQHKKLATLMYVFIHFIFFGHNYLKQMFSLQHNVGQYHDFNLSFQNDHTIESTTGKPERLG